MREYVMEALGTFVLVLAFGFTNNAIAIGILLSAMIYLGRDISGAHFNPAVSLAFFLKKKLSAADFTGYVFSQLFGAFLASVSIFFFSMMVFYVYPPADTNIYQQTGVELLFTCLFVLVMLNFSLTHVLRKNHLYGFITGLTYSGIILAGSQISGGVFNPAISISSALFDLLNGGDSYMHVLLYTVGPLAGGAIAVVIFNFFRGSKAA